jgi:hypothetical protein
MSSRLLFKKIKIKVYKIITFSLIFYGSETSSLALEEEHRLRMFANIVLKTIFLPKRDEIVEGWRKRHNEELGNIYPQPNIVGMIESRRMGWTEQVERMSEKRNACRILVVKPDGRII